jgi:23S rRNA (cytidine1920-2'-O)/16S rRNA (cytidine1409-2'-O)-methyltransferase
MAGQVRVDGQVVLKSSAKVDSNANVEIDRGPRYVSRGGEKLQAALQAFNPDVAGRVCADVGASTGGFTDCLLQHGAARVYTIDVGKGVLDWKLRQNPQVMVMEGTNARYVEHLPEPVNLVTIDASFISLKILLPVVHGWFLPPSQPIESNSSEVVMGDVIALVKPQFEAGREAVKRGKGVIRDTAVHQQVLSEVLSFAQNEGYSVGGLIRSPLLGPKGNVEFLAWLSWPGLETLDLTALIDSALGKGYTGEQ